MKSNRILCFRQIIYVCIQKFPVQFRGLNNCALHIILIECIGLTCNQYSTARYGISSLPLIPPLFSLLLFYFLREREKEVLPPAPSFTSSVHSPVVFFSCARVNIHFLPTSSFLPDCRSGGKCKKKVKLPCSRFSFPILRIYKNLKLYLKKKKGSP